MRILLILLFAIFAYAVEIDATSFEADFIQTVKNEQGKSFKYSGQITAKKPNLAFWKYIKPFKKEIFVSGKKIIVYEPNLAQATISDDLAVPNIYELAKKAKQNQNGEYETTFDGIKVMFKLVNGLPEKIFYKDKIENSVEIIFSNLKKNQVSSDKIFEFTPPQGVDIIRQ